MDIEYVHVPRILILINIWENYRLLNLVIFEKWQYIFYIEYINCPTNSSHSFWVKSLLFCWIITGCWTWSFLSTYSIYRVHHLSGYLLPQFSSEDLLVLQTVSMDIRDMHIQKILIFSIFCENYRLLNVVVFEEWEYIFYIGYINLVKAYMCMDTWMLNIQVWWLSYFH
jgi:hypothetical protein